MRRNQTSTDGGRTATGSRVDPGELSVFLAKCGPGQGRIVEVLRRMVRRNAPGASEGIRFNCLCFFAPGKHFGAIGGNICMIEAKEAGVRLSFIHGAALDDPSMVLRGAGKHKRYVEIRTAGEASAGEVAALVRCAAARATRAKKRAAGRPARPRGSWSR